MEIVVIRHGKSIVDTSGIVNPSEFGEGVKNYDKSGIDETYLPSAEAIKAARSCHYTVCSNLCRSVDSANLLGLEKPDVISALYRECEMPHGNWAFPKLPVFFWSGFFRVLQLLSYSPNAESYREAKQRTKNCANDLQKLAKEHSRVLYIGHGSLSWLLHRDLLSMGWLGPEKSVRQHWEFGIYRYKEIGHTHLK